MVLAKSGAAGSWVMASTSAVWSAKARSKAGRKCSGRIASNGGVSNGVCQGRNSGFKSGLSCAFEGAVFAFVSDITKSRFRRKFTGESITRDAAFLRLLRLKQAAFSERLRPARKGPNDEHARPLDRPPPDRLAERHHRHL